MKEAETVRRVFFPNLSPLVVLMALIPFAAKDGVAQRVSMELLDTKISATQETIDIVGQVKNISTREVNGVTVFCDFQDVNGKSIRVEEGSLATDPLAPSKISQFKISTRYNPQIKRFNVTFSEMFGGPLVTKDSRKQ